VEARSKGKLLLGDPALPPQLLDAETEPLLDVSVQRHLKSLANAGTLHSMRLQTISNTPAEDRRSGGHQSAGGKVSSLRPRDPISRETPFYRFVREERLFCTILVHLLLQQGRNLKEFLELANSQLHGSPIDTAHLEKAEVYMEFTRLRDHWSSLGRDNDAKRELILDLLERADGLIRHLDAAPRGIAEFNQFFMGSRGGRILKDIAYPGSWSISTLGEKFGGKKEVFREFCRFKWAFNIKPDIVVVVPGSGPLCIEAKLESKEGQYPASPPERAIFDRVFGRGQGRVQQVELQRFMFEQLLATPCHLLTIGRRPVGRVADSSRTPFVAWAQVFQALDIAASIPYVHRLIGENPHINVA
jgi:hypothetical protein